MNAISKKFYAIFWNNEACKNIFSLHKEQLLEKKELEIGNEKRTYYLQKIVLSNNKLKKLKTDVIEARLENKKVDLNENLEVSTNKYLDKARFEALIETHLGKTINKIEKKFKSGTISQMRFAFDFLNSLSSESKFIKFLKTYHVLPENINSLSELEGIFNKKVSSLISNDALLEFIDSIDKLADIYAGEVYQNLFDSNKFYDSTFYENESFKDRLNLFDMLYDAKVLESGINKTYYECYNCDESVFKAIATIKAKPSKINLKCPICKNDSFYLAPYRINDEIFNHITQKDGLIKEAVKYLLIENGLNVKENYILPPDIELDLFASNNENHSVIVELKMYKTDTPYNTQLANLNTAINKLINAKLKILKLDRSFNNVSSILISNYQDKDLLAEVRIEHKTKMKELKIKIFTLGEFQEYLSHTM